MRLHSPPLSFGVARLEAVVAIRTSHRILWLSPPGCRLRQQLVGRLLQSEGPQPGQLPERCAQGRHRNSATPQRALRITTVEVPRTSGRKSLGSSYFVDPAAGFLPA